jgi:dTDP-4-dehydrorhamnose reductase
MTDVDGCERRPAAAWRANGAATRLVAAACRRSGSRLVAISTDYVLDGLARRPLVEGDTPRPLSVYGETKLAAEAAVAGVADGLIVRTQWLFGAGRRNFISAILERAGRGEELRVVADQWGCPTWTAHLAPMVWRAALAGWVGVLHVAARGVATWLDVALAALDAAGLRARLTAVSLDDWPSAARRPRFAPLATDRYAELAGGSPPGWREGVAEYARMAVRGKEAQGR